MSQWTNLSRPIDLLLSGESCPFASNTGVVELTSIENVLKIQND